MKNKTFYIQTFGCQMNVADSDYMASVMESSGFKRVDDAKNADIILVNTCTVRDHAEHRALSYIGRLKFLKRKKPDLKIIFAGCAAQRLGENIKKKFPYVDLVAGAKEIERFAELFSAVSGCSASGPSEHAGTSSISALVTIMRGCENFCSYCIVPYVRGKEVSRPVAEIISEIRELVKNGVKEITLLGQNVNSYKDNSQNRQDAVDFPGLLKLVNDIEGVERIRFMTSHPKDLSDKLIDAMATLKKVCGHLHLPLQSGSDNILKAMNRGYTRAGYLELVKKARANIPGLCVTTDVLVGFPGETDLDFRDTIKLMEEIEFDFLFAFKYSPRQGTKAFEMTDDVPREAKEKRHAEILALANSISLKKNAKLLNSAQEVLVEESDGSTRSGRTRANKKVFFTGNAAIGECARVRISDSRINSLTGEMI